MPLHEQALADKRQALHESDYRPEGIALPCTGCAHSASGAPFPGIPSGERPCFFCVRNPYREEAQNEYTERFGKPLQAWYGGSEPVSVPMDCYHTVDMKKQLTRWLDEVSE